MTPPSADPRTALVEAAPAHALEELRAFGVRVLVAAGAACEDAAVVAECLVEADARGIGSHGLSRLTTYCAALRGGGISARPQMRLARPAPGVAVLDADFGFGHLAMRAATDAVLEVVEETGVALAAVRRSTHFGIASHWSERIARAGAVGVVTSTTAARVAPYGARDALFGTNPIAISVPGEDGSPVTLDFAISQTAHGKIAAASAANETIPPDWALDGDGRATTDPAAALEGALLPFGGAKGSGLGFMVEALTAGLAGSAFSHESGDIWADPGARLHVGHLALAISPARLDAAELPQRVGALVRTVRAAAPLDGGGPVLAPGDREVASLAAARSDGVRLAPATATALHALAEQLDVAPLDGSPVAVLGSGPHDLDGRR
jgi:L-2-hydroxycarboxylate dehydrogenase (NAD+)